MRKGSWLAFLTFMCLASSALGAEYADNNFKFSYPDNWAIASSTEQNAIKGQADKVLNSQQSDSTALILLESGTTNGFKANCNVQIIQQSSRITEQDLPEIQKGFESGIGEKLHANFTSITSSIIKVDGGNAALVKSTYTSPMIQNGQAVICWTLITSGSSKSYIFTFTAPAADAGNKEKTFQTMIDSIEIEPQSGNKWFKHLSPVWKYSIEGGVLGLAASIILVLIKKARSKSQTQASPMA